MPEIRFRRDYPGTLDPRDSAGMNSSSNTNYDYVLGLLMSYLRYVLEILASRKANLTNGRDMSHCYSVGQRISDRICIKYLFDQGYLVRALLASHQFPLQP